ncbi:11913_t:CDS:2, partial [Dentiscutata erythropus]
TKSLIFQNSLGLVDTPVLISNFSNSFGPMDAVTVIFDFASLCKCLSTIDLLALASMKNAAKYEG